MHIFSIEALWTHRSIQYDSSHLDDNLHAIITDFEQKYSRFIIDSEISQLNRMKTIEASGELLELIQLWKQAFEMSNWFFSPFVWSLLDYNGYDAEYSFTKKDDLPIYETKLDFSWTTITLWEHTTIDVWGRGKWYLIDKLAKHFHEQRTPNWIINWWWDIRFSRTDQRYMKPLGISHVQDPTLLIAERSVSVWAIATSSSLVRKRWEEHHLVDPKTWSSTDNNIISVSVFAQTACLADIWATTLFVWWKEQLQSMSEKLDVEYLTLMDNNSLLYTADIEWLEVFDW